MRFGSEPPEVSQESASVATRAALCHTAAVFRYIRIMSRILLASVVLTLLAIRPLPCSAVEDPLAVDGFAAAVNDRIITVSDVRSAMRLDEKTLRETLSEEELEAKRQELFEAARNDLVERALILEEYKKQKGQLPDRAVDDRITEVIRERYGNDRTAFLKALSEDRTTLAELRETLKEQLIITILRRQEVVDRIKISPSTARELYEARRDQYRVPAMVHLRSIALGKEAGVDKKTEAEGVRAKLAGGADFAETAKAVSQGSYAEKGGDWGWVDPTQLHAMLRDTISGLATGAVSSVVETDNDYFILMVEGRRDPTVRPFDDVERELMTELRDKEAERLHTDWMTRLRNRHYVKIY
jgi:parvulin-like peptidyl-prolyl isomerase